MKLKPCNGCGRLVSPQAEACPGCGHPVRPRTGPVAAFFQILFVLAILAGIAYCAWAFHEAGLRLE